jgi:hypothetical protein
MKLIPDTIAGRTIAVLLVGFLVFHAISICAYQIGVDSEVDLTNEIRLAERLFTIKRALASLPPTEREKTAHSLSGGPIEVHWSNVPLTVENTRFTCRRTQRDQRADRRSAPCPSINEACGCQLDKLQFDETFRHARHPDEHRALYQLDGTRRNRALDRRS